MTKETIHINRETLTDPNELDRFMKFISDRNDEFSVLLIKLFRLPNRFDVDEMKDIAADAVFLLTSYADLLALLYLYRNQGPQNCPGFHEGILTEDDIKMTYDIFRTVRDLENKMQPLFVKLKDLS